MRCATPVGGSLEVAHTDVTPLCGFGAVVFLHLPPLTALPFDFITFPCGALIIVTRLNSFPFQVECRRELETSAP